MGKPAGGRATRSVDDQVTAADLMARLDALSDPARAAALQGFFKTGVGEYGEGDVFIGLRMPQVRRVCRDFRAMPPVRRLSNTIGGAIFSVAVGRHIPDNQSGYRLIGRPLMEDLLRSRQDGFAFEVEMIARCIALDLPLHWVPIRTIYAGEPSHIRPWPHFVGFLRASRDARRIVRAGRGRAGPGRGGSGDSGTGG